jgi:hypothetical protein
LPDLDQTDEAHRKRCLSRKGHEDAHHKHEFDWATGAEIAGSPKWCGVEGWPTLFDFVMKVAEARITTIETRWPTPTPSCTT